MADVSKMEIVTNCDELSQIQLDMLCISVYTIGVPCVLMATPDRKEFSVVPVEKPREQKTVA